MALKTVDRRDLFKFSGAAIIAGAIIEPSWLRAEELETHPGRPNPIGRAEYQARVSRAQALMRQQGFAALIVEPGSSLVYFTGIRWWRSERLTCGIIPATGEVSVVTPFFEEPSIRESLVIDAQVLTWLEHEDPLAVVAAILSSMPNRSGAIGIEETSRHFIVDGLHRNLPAASIRNGAPIVRGCRMVKGPNEIALMQYATDITVAAYRYTIPRVRMGMGPADITSIMKTATERLGGNSEFEMALIGEAAAYPHGSGKPQIVRAGDIVLMDCGCSVEGYQSDVSRTFVLGTPSSRQRKVWNDVSQGQQVAFRATKLGVPAGSIDDAVRRYYESLGYGPDYRLPGLSHRTGHGIGLDGHEPINLVRGEVGVLQPGMCFSNEPGLYIPGEFGVRLEDCFFLTEQGPKWFSTPSTSIEQPFAPG